MLYGPGGIGKTKLASLLEAVGQKVAFCDIEDGTREIRPDVVQGLDSTSTWADLRGVLAADIWSGVNAIVIDTLTKAEELAVAHTLATVPHEKGHLVRSIEGYGFGKGFQHVYDTFLPLLADLDRHVREGRNVVLICHECISSVPNPTGEDFIRFEPRLQSPSSGKASIRHRVKEWCDHLLFVGYEVHTHDGKATGGGARTIYPVEQPTHWAKSRKLYDPIAYTDGSTALWTALFGG